MKTKFKRFLRKAKVFFKSNALAIVVCATTVLTIGVVALSTAISLGGGGELNPDTGIEGNVPVGATDPIVFEAPLDKVDIIKDYCDKSLDEDKTTGIWQTHQAIDFAGTEGDSVKAVFKGKIESVVSDMMDGTVITLQISDNLKVVYKCLAAGASVSAGDQVETGQELGKVGTNITEKADGFHIHLEVYENDKLVDPNNYFSFSDK